ncbi:dihydrofolate reductase family protein [Pseudonocardia sp. ICBG162]|uniref:RibD family protein n=1 Tax=Pseudonocardia sp. ICBG162 TaxID=2846761 RepID=UPI0021078464|nr:dihydrofolate reductase family protein [Pseudonocardia sp. ICBG162]
MSIDGYIDDASDERLLLSNSADFDRVDEVRAQSDAIMIGAGTLRADNPRLLVNSEERRAARLARGASEYPLKVTLSASGDLSPDAKFWHHGGAKVVYTTDAAYPELLDALGSWADVVSLGAKTDLGSMLDDLGSRGIEQLMVEGGSSIHTQFLAQGLADELQVAVAPLLVGEDKAPRFVQPAAFPGGPTHRLRLENAAQVGDVVVLRYLLRESESAA